MGNGVRGININGMVLRCIHCRDEYYLNDQIEEAKNMMSKEVLCPHCKRKVARRN